MPNDPYLDASVAWRIRTGNVRFNEADHQTTVESILSAGLATEVVGLISAGKEANVYLAGFKGAPIAVKVYRLYQTSHRGGRPIKLDSAGWLAAHEHDMLLQAWKAGCRVPAPARRVENMLSMRYLGGSGGPAPRLNDVVLEGPAAVLESVLSGVDGLAKAGVVHSDLSAYNVLMFDGLPWFIDLSEAVRVDRTGYSAWQRLSAASDSLRRGLQALRTYFRRYGLEVDVEGIIDRTIRSLDRYGVMDR